MKRALPMVVLSLVVAAVPALAQSQRLYVIPASVFTAEPADRTFQLPDLAERQETVKDLRGYLFGQVNSIVRVDEVSMEGRVAVEVVSRNVNAADGRLRDVHLRVAAAGQSFSVDGIGESWKARRGPPHSRSGVGLRRMPARSTARRGCPVPYADRTSAFPGARQRSTRGRPYGNSHPVATRPSAYDRSNTGSGTQASSLRAVPLRGVGFQSATRFARKEQR